MELNASYSPDGIVAEEGAGRGNPAAAGRNPAGEDSVPLEETETVDNIVAEAVVEKDSSLAAAAGSRSLGGEVDHNLLRLARTEHQDIQT